MSENQATLSENEPELYEVGEKFVDALRNYLGLKPLHPSIETDDSRIFWVVKKRSPPAGPLWLALGKLK